MFLHPLRGLLGIVKGWSRLSVNAGLLAGDCDAGTRDFVMHLIVDPFKQHG